MPEDIRLRPTQAHRSCIDDILPELVNALGLTMNESKVYLTLLKSDSLTATKISTHSGVHRSRVYDNLKGLEMKGLIESIESEPRRYAALPVREGLERIIGDVESQCARKVQEIRNLQHTLEQLSKPSKPQRIYMVSHSEILEEIRAHLKGAVKRVWVCKRAAGGILDWFMLKDDLLSLSRKGVDIRFLGSEQIRIPFPSRHNPEVAFSFAIIDSTAMTFLLENNVEESGAMVSMNQEYAGFLERTFTTWWDRAIR